MINRKERNRLYYITHKEELAQKLRLWQINNKEKVSLYNKRWRNRNKSYVRLKWSKYALNIFLCVLNNYGAICVMCHENDTMALTIDHIGGGGNKHRHKVGVGTKFYNWLIKNNFPPGFRVLCANCQLRLLRKETYHCVISSVTP